ncbi:hypothetical protein FRX94_09935 [Corynebacterium canis]|uniref:DUF6542 domain-containing protein n=1 Tax=Corynebacterium canis TaxID=679663 RepID=A0A5C5UBR5_9CORY|nr:DUF6542 domain-containing protein [Corynebacterium canis]TWT23052.1 hypothetical protein FRX94_09935 [Corynebacterium canis]WJY74800.1 hypothetical protein CCANI_04765 [Corynebacterium canis]
MTQHYRTSPDRLPAAARFGVPVWSATSIIFASLITGALLSMNFKELGAEFLWCFAAGAIVAVLFVEPRGLFITTAQLPFAFGVAMPITAWLVGRMLPGADGPITRTEIITAVYPLTEQFPFLMTVTVITVVIAFARWLLARNAQVRAVRRTAVKQQKVRKINQERAEQASRARTSVRTRRTHRAQSQSSQVTVQELMRQRRAASRHDDLYR